MKSALVFLIFIPVLGWSSPAEEPEEEIIPILETTQDFLGNKVNNVANRLDMFFADERADDELGRSRIRLRYNYNVRERSSGDGDYQIRFNLRLPHLEEKFRFKFDEDLSETKKKEIIKKEAKKDIKNNELNTNWNFKADSGIVVSVPPKIRTRARLRKNWQTGPVIHRFVEELGWFSDRDWEERTTFFSDYSLSEESLLRFSNSKFWGITRNGFTTAHGPGVFQRLSDDEAISYSLSMGTIVKKGIWYVTNYTLSTSYRLNLYKQWLYFNVSPGIDFPKEWSFRRTPFIFFQLEALFGGR